MSEGRESEGLAQVYAAETPQELAQAYAAWSAEYDRETAASGYCLPFLIAAWVARYVAKDAGPLLDAGCGTGLSGPALKALGYEDITGLDMSPEMLGIAGSRQAYRALAQAALGGPLPWADGHFAAFFSTGVFTQGHAPASSLEELVRITRPGGMAIFTVRDVVLDAGGFFATFKALEDAGRWRMLEESPAFRAFAIDEADVLVKAFVFEVV
ncbi:class I SAM-dependent DNA methyltransferase [Mesorhizobium sp. A556]